MRFDGGRQYRRRKAICLKMGSKSKMSKVLFWILEFLLLAGTAPSMHITVHERIKVNL